MNNYFQNEGGCHRWIRIPPTEKRGRTQTSVISVAITHPHEFNFKLNRDEVVKNYIRGSGNGGQKINKTSVVVQLIHEQSGIMIKCQEARDRGKNEEIAWNKLEEKLKEMDKTKYDKSVYSNRFDQIGYADRSDKRRTYRLKDDVVIDHITGKSCSFKDFSKGKIELLN